MSLENSPELESRDLKSLFTVGHSNCEFAPFINLLENSRVELLVDVRSRPHSSRFPQFSQPGFEALLAAEKISYLFLGEELGGRPDDADAYRSDGLVDYRARRKSYAFRAGLERLVMELEKKSTAIMCAERVYFQCHRMLVSDYLTAHGHKVLHIDSAKPTREHTLMKEAWVNDGRLLYIGDRLF